MSLLGGGNGFDDLLLGLLEVVGVGRGKERREYQRDHRDGAAWLDGSQMQLQSLGEALGRAHPVRVGGEVLALGHLGQHLLQRGEVLEDVQRQGVLVETAADETWTQELLVHGVFSCQIASCSQPAGKSIAATGTACRVIRSFRRARQWCCGAITSMQCSRMTSAL